MKFLLSAFILTFPLLSWSDTDQLSSFIENLDQAVEPKTNCEHMTESDLAMYCAQEVCGNKKDDVAVITASNYRKVLTAEEAKEIDSIPQRIRAYLSTLENNAKLIDQKILAIKNGKASAADLMSSDAEKLVSLYPFASKVSAMVKEKVASLPDISATCKSARVFEIVNGKRPQKDLYQEGLAAIDAAVISKFSPDSATKLRGFLQNNVSVNYRGLQSDPFHVGPYYLDKNPMVDQSVGSMTSFANKIGNHVNGITCSSSLSNGPEILITDSVVHDPANKQMTLNISPYNCTHGNSTPTIVAHEIGHMLSNFMASYGPSSGSKKKFLEHRSCVKTQGSKNADTKKNRFSGDYMTTEEDHADALAFEIGNKNATLCAFLASDGSQFMNLDYKTNPASSHSPSLLRILRDFNQKGMKLPDTCRELAKRSFPKGAFVNCPL